MNEAEFNRIIKNTIIKKGGFAYKISDAQGSFGQKRPFDGIGILPEISLFWESKFSRGLKSFDLKRLFEGSRGHQMETFESIRKINSFQSLWIPYCCYSPRDSKVYIFSFDCLQALYNREGIKSIQKKVLEELTFLKIKTENKIKILEGNFVPLPYDEIKKALNLKGV
jgi:hypothetical protein